MDSILPSTQPCHLPVLANPIWHWGCRDKGLHNYRKQYFLPDRRQGTVLQLRCRQWTLFQYGLGVGNQCSTKHEFAGMQALTPVGAMGEVVTALESYLAEGGVHVGRVEGEVTDTQACQELVGKWRALRQCPRSPERTDKC